MNLAISNEKDANLAEGNIGIFWLIKAKSLDSCLVVTFDWKTFQSCFTVQCCLFGNVSFGKRLSSVISPESRLFTRLWNFHNLKLKILILMKYIWLISRPLKSGASTLKGTLGPGSWVPGPKLWNLTYENIT